MEHMIKKLQTDGVEFNFEVCDWGSCQYSGAFAIFNLFKHIRTTFSINDTITILNKGLGWDINIDNIKRKSLIKIKFDIIQEHFIPHILDLEIISNDDNLLESELSGASTTIANIANCKDVDCIFHVLRKQSWDLWTTADVLFWSGFTGIVDSKVKINRCPGIGPEFNKIIQAANFRTGMYCALLEEFELIKNPSFSFSNFDT